jgi:putative hemolysin
MIKTIIYSNKGVIGIKQAKNLLFIAIILIAISFVMGCQKQLSPEGDGDIQIANPSATYCVEQGNDYLIKTAPDGSQSGICKLKDGTTCEGWAYYRKECGAESGDTAPDRNGSEPDAGDNAAAECTVDSDCKPYGCCHPTRCANKNLQPSCAEVMCTMECRPGTLDCGQGSCSCIDGNCEAVMK